MKMIFKKINHVHYRINARCHELIGEDEKYYYFKRKNGFAKVQKLEDGKELYFLKEKY